MPIIKPISGHTDTQRIQAYLEKDGRALARDFFNLSWDEVAMAGYDKAIKDAVVWADEMDQLRAAFGNDQPHGGRPARTFKHYVVSPDPEDRITLEALRELACAWAKENFSEYQVAIVYHDDNAEHIPHAHVVVNNTNLVTGRRLQDPVPRELKQSIQDLAQKRGLRFLSNDAIEGDGFSKLASLDDTPETPVRTRQEAYLSRAERRVLASGEYSWVSDIRDRVTIAKNLARNESEFLRLLDAMEIDVEDNSPKTKRDDWIYSLRDQGAKRVSGERLGYAFGKEALQTRFSRAGSTGQPLAIAKAILTGAADAVEINDLADLHRLAETLEVNDRFHVHFASDYSKRIDGMRAKLDQAPTQAARRGLEQGIDRLLEAQRVSAKKGLLPDSPKPTGPKEYTPAQRAAAAQRAKAQRAAQAEQSRHRSHDQHGRDNRHR